MSRSRLAGLLLVCAVGVAGAVWLWPPGDRRLIARQLEAVAAAASTSETETALVRAAAAARVAGFFTDDVVVNVDGPGSPVSGRDGVMAVAAQARGVAGPLRVGVEDVRIALDGPQDAAAYFTLTISGVDRGDGGLVDAREIWASFRKVEGTWLIARVDVLPTLERQP